MVDFKLFGDTGSFTIILKYFIEKSGFSVQWLVLHEH